MGKDETLSHGNLAFYPGNVQRNFDILKKFKNMWKRLFASLDVQRSRVGS